MKTHTRRLMCGTRCAILGWYDLLCPFCYIGQSRKAVRRGMVSPGRPDIPEIRPEIPRGGISKRLSVYLYTLRGFLGVGSSTADVGLTVLLTPKAVSAIRHDEVNKYSAVILAELPNGLQIASLNSNGRR
jgi:hypothetical protein